jgi:membrane protein CcdC involved in cytochrome C biogenesis
MYEMDGNTVYVMIAGIAALILWRRTRSMYRPIRGNGIRLLLPMLFLLPGLSMIFNTAFFEHSWAYGIALCIGLVMSIPLIWTTDYEIREDRQIYAKKNWGFVVAFIGIVLIRLFLRRELSGLDPQETMALFLMAAIGYIIPWRIVSFVKFRRVASQSGSRVQAHT